MKKRDGKKRAAAKPTSDVITIDGPAGAGKSTAARRLAAALGYTYVDSGAMYRAVGLAARRRDVGPDDAAALAALVESVAFVAEPDGTRVLLDGEDVTAELRAADASIWASRIATHALVRERLVERQRALAAAGGVVMDGRDIGTVVFPEARYKFFLTANPEERARRRRAQDEGSGIAGDLATARAEIDARDQRDRERAVAPLRPAADAVVIDNSALTPDAIVTRILKTVRARARP
jgi:cytidylate kinase